MCDAKTGIKTKGSNDNNKDDKDDVNNGQSRPSRLGVDKIWLRPGCNDLLGRMHADSGVTQTMAGVLENEWIVG